MKLEDIVYLTEHYYGTSSQIFDGPRISSERILSFKNNLAEEEINIYQHGVTKEINYDILMSPKLIQETSAKLPFETDIIGEKPIAFYLYGEYGANEISLELRNYDNRIQNSLHGEFGGRVTGQRGIECKMIVEGIDVDTSILGNIKNALYKTYDWPNLSLELSKLREKA